MINYSNVYHKFFGIRSLSSRLLLLFLLLLKKSSVVENNDYPISNKI